MQATSLPKFFDRYIKLSNDISLLEAFRKYAPSVVFDIQKLNQLEDKVYAENKWTVKQILQHCIDTERIMAYRALRFARNDTTALAGFDENSYAENADTANVTLPELMDEFSLVRQANVLLFKKLSESELNRVGLGSNIEISVLHLGYVIIGHAIHHQNIISERYYPILS